MRGDNADLLQRPLSIDQNMGKDCLALSGFLNPNFPLTFVVLPYSLNNSGVESDVSVKIPLLGGADDVLLDFGTAGVEVGPLWVRVEWECLPSLSVLMNNGEAVGKELT
jgi:hypothetical protein